MKNAWSHHIHNNNEYHIKKKKKEPRHEKKMPGEWREQALQGVARQFVEMHETDRPIFMLDVVIVQKKLGIQTVLCATIFYLTHLINFSHFDNMNKHKFDLKCALLTWFGTYYTFLSCHHTIISHDTRILLFRLCADTTQRKIKCFMWETHRTAQRNIAKHSIAPENQYEKELIGNPVNSKQ